MPMSNPRHILEVAVGCTKCEQIVIGRIHFSPQMQVVDTDGGLLFETGWTCHNCLGEPWSSSDLVIDFSTKKGTSA